MPDPTPHGPSFSPRRRWKIGLDVVLRTALVAAVVVMVNYLGAQFLHRFYLSSQTRVSLSSRTLSVLHSLTNRIAVTVYYDKQDDFYHDVLALLDEYQQANPLITLKVVDYVRDAGEAEKIKEQYHLDATADKNLVIFDAGNGRCKIASGDALVLNQLEMEPSQDPRQAYAIKKKHVAFQAEEMFTAVLLALDNPHPFKAYFLQGHGEPSLADTGNTGYLQFAATLAQNYVAVTNLELAGDNPVPADCDLLIIAGSTGPFDPSELDKIEQYLTQGGRMLALFSFASIQQPTGLEPILQRQWGVNIAYDYVKDPDTYTGRDVVVRKFSQHPIVNSLIQSAMQMYLPRPVSPVNWQSPPPNPPEVIQLAASSQNSTLAGDPTETPRSYPLMVAVEQKPVAGVASPRGYTRIVVVGDSIFAGNYYIHGGSNRDFIANAVNWLLERPSLLQGIGPRPVTEFRLLMTQSQRVEVRWLLLAALPGVVLLFGGVVWLVRRK